MSKRSATLDGFLKSTTAKTPRLETAQTDTSVTTNGGHLHNADTPQSTHPTYAFPILHLPDEIMDILNFAPAVEAKIINDQPHLDLLYFQPYVPKDIQRSFFEFLRRELFFYKVIYNIKRGPVETTIRTPRYTTVFGLDETSRFTDDGDVIDATTKKVVSSTAYKCKPRLIPQCLDELRKLTENATGCKFNFALVNYYASGDDSISYHSDDERFLGPEPAIASFSLGAKRDFLIRHKKTPAGHPSETKPTKFPLASGDMILMRGQTQKNWDHSIPKRKGPGTDEGRINITFRRAMVKGGTENYYRYNVGDGEPLKWDSSRREMLPYVRRPSS